MEKTNKKIIGIIFLISILCMFALLLLSEVIIRKIDNHDLLKNRPDEYNIYESFSLEDEEKDADEGMGGNCLLNKIESLFYRIERRTSSGFYFKEPFVLMKKRCDKWMGLDMTTSLCSGKNDPDSSEDLVLEFQEDYLGFVMDDMDISDALSQIVSFGKQMQDEGRNFLFFLNPGKYAENHAWKDYSKEKEDEVKHTLHSNGLDVVCISEFMEGRGMDQASLFFKTDHHWLPQTGIWADGILCETMNQKYGYCFDTSFFDIENYNVKQLKNLFLGSMGQKVTEAYCKREDFPIVTPRYDTDLEVFISGKNKKFRGSIEDTLMNPDYSYLTAYASYGYGDQALITIHNNLVHDGSRILMLKTSYANVMYPFLAAVVENLDVIDLRHFGKSLQSYINETNPDTVVYVTGIGQFAKTSSKRWLFDFR